MKIVHIGTANTPKWQTMLAEALNGQKVISMAVVALYVPENADEAEPAVFTCCIADADPLPFTLIGALETVKMEIMQGMDGIGGGNA